MDVSIIILTKNGGADFPGLIERIYSQNYSGSFEVIVIDSGSTDGTLDKARKYPVRLRQIAPQEFHHGRTRNLGADIAEGQYLVFITQDALPLDDRWLQKLTANFNDPQVAMVVGRQIPRENTRPPEKFFYYYNFPDFKIVVKSDSTGYYHDNVFISNVNAAYRKAAFQKYRFSENIVMSEDKEIAIRIINDGMSICYEPSAAVYHSHNYGIKDIFYKSLDDGLSLKQGVSLLPKTKKNLLLRISYYLKSEIGFLRDTRCGPVDSLFDNI